MNGSIRMLLIGGAIATTGLRSTAEIRDALARRGCEATTRTVQRDLNSLRRYFGADLRVVGRAGGYRYRWVLAPFDSESPELMAARMTAPGAGEVGATDVRRRAGCSSNETHLRSNIGHRACADEGGYLRNRRFML